MKLKVLLPTEIFINEEVEKVVAEADNGYFCLLPRHVDFVSALVPGGRSPFSILRRTGSSTSDKSWGSISGRCVPSFSPPGSLIEIGDGGEESRLSVRRGTPAIRSTDQTGSKRLPVGTSGDSIFERTVPAFPPVASVPICHRVVRMDHLSAALER